MDLQNPLSLPTCVYMFKQENKKYSLNLGAKEMDKATQKQIATCYYIHFFLNSGILKLLPFLVGQMGGGISKLKKMFLFFPHKLMVGVRTTKPPIDAVLLVCAFLKADTKNFLFQVELCSNHLNMHKTPL